MSYTVEQLERALRKADAAGDVEAARAIAQQLRSQMPSAPPAGRVMQPPTAATRQLGGGRTYDMLQNIPDAPANPDFNPGDTEAWLSAMQAGGKQKAQYDAGVRRSELDASLPDSDTKERSMALLNSVTFGNAPRLAAGAQTLGALAATPFVEGDIIDREGISGATSQFLDENRIHQRRGREERPLESIGLEVVPALFQGKTIVDTLGKKLLPQANTAANVARVAGTGGAYGALYGASQDESGTLEGAGEGAAIGGGLGIAGGVAIKALQSPATVALRKSKEAGASIYDALSSALGRAGGARDRVAEDVAIAAVRRSMERSGMSIDQVMDLVQRYEGKPAVLAEVLGQDAINALTALTRRPGSTPQKAQDLIEERFYGRPDRMKADVEEATGIQIGQLDETLSTQLEARQEAAKPIYDALYKRFNTIKSFGESLKRINRIARTPAMQKHLKLAEEAVKTQAALRQVPISKMSKMEYWDLVKRSLDDEINSAVAKGEARTKVGASVADLTQLKKAITDEFDRLTDGAYATAREAGGEAPRLKAAAAAGQKALQARNPREVARTVAATLAQDLPALRAGMVDDLGTRIDKGMTPGRVRVPDVAGKLRSGLGEESANKLINKFDAEATLSETGARWAPRMNSVTGTVLESGATQMGDDLVNAGINLATGNKVGLFRQAINFMRTQGFSQRQIDAIGDLLLSSPEEGLKRLRVMKPDGAPSAAIGAASGGGDLPPSGTPTPSPSTPAKAKSGKAGTRTADAAAIAALSIAPPAQADTGGGAELEAANERVNMATQRVADVDANITSLKSELDLLERAYARDPNVDATKVQLILDARGFDLGPKGADGRIGPDTREAIKGNIAAIKGEITKEEGQREKAVSEVADARKGVTQAEMRMAQQEAEVSPMTKALREIAPWAGTAAGIAIAGFSRRGAVAKSRVAAQQAAARANTLLNASTKVSRAQRGPDALSTRAANLNEFWRLGGAGENVPFKKTKDGKWTQRPKPMEPSQLFPAEKFPLRSMDAGVMAGGALEAGGSQLLINDNKQKADKARQDIQRYADKSDLAGVKRAQAELEEAENMVALATAARNLGLMIAGGRGIAALKMPYAQVRPGINMAAAEDEQALLLSKMKK